MTAAEQHRFDADAELLGPRVAYWLLREAQGWSALDELTYWTSIPRSVAGTQHPPVWSPFDQRVA
jgi:hypothetical protein